MIALSWEIPPQTKTSLAFTVAHFTLHADPVAPGALPEIQLPSDLPLEGLILSGRGPLWLYAYLVDLARPFTWVATFDPRFGGGIVVMRNAPEAPPLGTVVPCQPRPELAVPATVEISPDPIRWQRSSRASDEACWVELILPAFGKAFAAEELARLEDSLQSLELPNDAKTPIVFSGQLPVWLAAALVAQVSQKQPLSPLAFYDPKLAEAVIAVPGNLAEWAVGTTLPDQQREQPAPAWALIGDPNSGKSTLSWKLYRLLQTQLRVYRFDCDAMAPTPEYSLAYEQGRAWRKFYKKKDWEPGDPQRLARCIQRLCRSQLDLVFLDMPGGDHRNAENPLRIPEDRGELFQQVDHFLLLDNGQGKAVPGWTAALETIGLADRIRAIVLSCHDGSLEESGPTRQDGQTHFVIQGLNREEKDRETPGVQALAGWVQAFSANTT